jgi:hypothetical protein
MKNLHHHDISEQELGESCLEIFSNETRHERMDCSITNPCLQERIVSVLLRQITIVQLPRGRDVCERDGEA